MMTVGTTHIGVATDHVVESFRNELWPGYKTGEGIEPALFAQFPLLEEVLTALGVKVWPMVEFEADDALASAAAEAAADPRVARVLCARRTRTWRSRCAASASCSSIGARRTIRDEAGVVAKFGVGPASIPDYLALVGDASDGYPGLPGWGAKSSAAVLAKYEHIESIPADWTEWKVNATRAAALAATLERERDRAMLFKELATLRTDVPVFENVDELKWTGPTETFAALANRLDAAETEDRSGGSGRDDL